VHRYRAVPEDGLYLDADGRVQQLDEFLRPGERHDVRGRGSDSPSLGDRQQPQHVVHDRVRCQHDQRGRTADSRVPAAGDGSIAFSSTNPITGTAVVGTSAAITSQTFNAGNNHYAVLAAQATGSGTANGTVIVNFSKGNNVSTTIDVVQLSGNNTSTPIAGSAISTGTGTTANGGSLSPGNSGDGEVFFAGLSGSTTMSTPTGGYAALDVPANTAHGSWFRSSASPSGVTTNLGASGTWGTIEIEINHG
jgi:hypothetical protein